MNSYTALFLGEKGKKIAKRFLSCVLVSLCLMLMSCDSRTAGLGKNIGKLRLSLMADTTSIHKGAVSNTTKAVSDEFADFLNTADYRILIMQGSDTVKVFERYDEMPSVVELPEGSYSLIAGKGTDLPAAFNNPYFEGNSNFTVKEDMETPMDVTCTLGNARVTAEYTEDFMEAYEKYTVLLSTTFTKEDLKIAQGETRAAYMKTAKEGSEMIVGITLKKVGEEKEKTYYVPTPLKLERKQNVHLIFKTDGETLNGIKLEIVLDDEMTDVTLTTEIPDFMWKPFMKPELKPDGFVSGETVFEVQAGLFELDPVVNIKMPAGIGSLHIKYWRSDEDEEDAVVCDLGTDEGVALAKEKHFSWSSAESKNINLREKKEAKLLLQGGINSLESPVAENESYIYHFKIYGADNNIKPNESEVLTFDVKVLPAGSPLITSKKGDDMSDIVESEELDSDWILSFVAPGQIDHEATKVVIDNKEYLFMSDNGAALQAKYGAILTVESAAKLTLTFPKAFAAKLLAPENGGNNVYAFTFYLKDKNGKESTPLRKTIAVNAPEFTVTTMEGDAFARRIVLRASMPRGSKEKLSFQYRSMGSSTWLDVNGNLKLEDNINYVDTLKSLAESKKYDVRALYKGIRTWVSNEVTVITETPGTLPNAEFENWYSEKTDRNGNPITKNVDYVYWDKWFPWAKNDMSTAGWNTVNRKTTQDGSSPSVVIVPTPPYVGCCYVANSGTVKTIGKYGNGALIRTIGWGSGGTATGSSNDAKKITPGELFLGEVNDNTFEPIYGHDFSSRPTGFSFDYKYESKQGSGDHFIAEIVILDVHGNEIARQGLSQSEAINSGSWSNKTVYIDYRGNQSRFKAAKMYIRFKSSYSDDESFLRNNLMVLPPFANLSDGESIGSQLYIDNVQLIYE